MYCPFRRWMTWGLDRPYGWSLLQRTFLDAAPSFGVSWKFRNRWQKWKLDEVRVFIFRPGSPPFYRSEPEDTQDMQFIDFDLALYRTWSISSWHLTAEPLSAIYMYIYISPLILWIESQVYNTSDFLQPSETRIVLALMFPALGRKLLFPLPSFGSGDSVIVR